VKIVFCHCVYSTVVPKDVKDATFAALSASDHDIVSVPDLCGLAARRDPRLREWSENEGLAIVACHPRTVLWLFDWAGVPLEPDNVSLHNMRAQSAQDIAAALPGVEAGAEEEAPPATVPEKDGEWVPWFPVIDRLRCKNCRQCLNFCPFGVYELSEDKQVVVRNPRNCKTNCPACARLCPEVAIIFPKYAQDPINGAPVRDADVEQRKAKALQEQLKKQDIHSILAQRSACAVKGCDACSTSGAGESQS
jgi:NAD-dependent dihydropyrimidine dehydrogenase PreA subunit